VTSQDGIKAGVETTRLSAEEQDRIYRAGQAEATRRMAVCVADQEVADALGVDPTPGPGVPCGSWPARVQRLATGRACETCGTPAIKRRETADA
jgi:hypothetical protein